MAYIIVLNPLILGFAPGHDGQFLGGGDRAQPAGDRRRHGAGRRRDDDPDGRRRQLPAGAGDRPRPERVRGVLDRQPDDLGRRDGPGRARGRGHPGPGAHRLPDGGLPRRPGPAEDRDLGRHRPVHRADRLRRRRLRAPYPRRRRHHRAGAARRRRASSPGWPVLVFVLGLALVITLWVRKVQGRDPDLDRRDHRPGDHRRGDRRHRPDVGADGSTTRRAGGSTCPAWPDKVVRHPALRHPARRRSPLGSFDERRRGHRRSCSSSR